jgi:hypothetical protein
MIVKQEQSMKAIVRRTAMALVVTSIVSGCGALSMGGGGGSSAPYDIATNRQTYTRGNVGEATIRNAAGENLEYNLCPRRLERQVDRNWIAAYEWPTAGSACTTDARTLKRGESVNTFFDVPTGLATGTYRVVFTGLRGKDRGTVSADRAATPAFGVR